MKNEKKDNSMLLTKKNNRETHVGHVDFCSARKASNGNDYVKFIICTPDGEFTGVSFDEMERNVINYAYAKELCVRFHLVERYVKEMKESRVRFEGIRLVKD